MRIYKYVVLLVLFIITTISIFACSSTETESKIELYTKYDETNKSLAGLTDHIKPGETSYIALRYGKPFGKDVIEAHIDIPGDPDFIEDHSISVSPNDDTVVVEVNLKKLARYEITFFFEDSSEPIAKGEFFVLEQ